ncbi:MAG: PKD domain-containing protein [Spirochaetales bacterium]|nr:PKD domain-containing protein [Spirochaetales bacterium]
MNKKKCIALFLLLFGISRLFAAECGDVNGDGAADIVDALLIAQYYVDLNPQNFDSTVANVNGDNNIDIVDALLVAQYYVNLIDELTGCGSTELLGTVFAVNCGGSAYIASDGTQYAADTGYSGGTAYDNGSSVSGTSDPSLYSTERYGSCTYSASVPNGEFLITLHFAENYHTSAGSRVFDVAIEGTETINDLDIYAQAGGTTAYVTQNQVTVRDGEINIEFVTVTENALINAIKIDAVSYSGEPIAIFTLDPQVSKPGETVTVNASESNDPDGSITNYEINWGDGTTTNGAVTSHVYNDEGTYTITLTVTDNEGKTGTSSKTIAVSVSSNNIFAYPAYPGAVTSPLYSVRADDTTIFTEKLTKYSGEMQVHYAHFSLNGTATIQVTVNESFNSYTLSPKSRNIATSRNGNTLSFTTGPNYLVLAVDSKELLFILIDSPEENPPQLGDSNVKNILDNGVDNTGGRLETSRIQSAINASSGSSQNILYFPPGKYLVGELWLKSNMTMYLEGGAILYGSNNTSDFNTGSGGVNIEGMQHALIRISNCTNTNLIGRGVIDGNGKRIRAAGLNAAVLKMDNSSDILVDGIISRDSSYWNTIPYRCDRVEIKNYKVINCRPTSTTWNNTDGVDFDECTNSSLYNAFLYGGDDNMAVKNENQSYNGSSTMNTRNIHHEKVVTYSNSVGCKIGTKTMGQTMQNITFKDIDIVAAHRAIIIDAYDTAVISNTRFEDIRVEYTKDILIGLEEDDPPDWRDCANQCIIRDTYFTNVSSDTRKVINLHGRNSTYKIDGVHFSNFRIQGNPVTSTSDPDASWSINSYAYNITF